MDSNKYLVKKKKKKKKERKNERKKNDEVHDSDWVTTSATKTINSGPK